VACPFETISKLACSAAQGLRRKFDDPIELPDGRKLGVAIVGGPIVA
jgi:hypothetical protein